VAGGEGERRSVMVNQRRRLGGRRRRCRKKGLKVK
jgi:hypothetical protein